MTVRYFGLAFSQSRVSRCKSPRQHHAEPMMAHEPGLNCFGGNRKHMGIAKEARQQTGQITIMLHFVFRTCLFDHRVL